MKAPPSPEAIGAKIPLTAHLLDLRARILRSISVVCVIFIVLFYFANELYLFIATPLLEALPPGASMIATQVTAPFLMPLKLSVVCSFFVGFPYIIHQVWGFISPGLYRHEKTFAVPLLILSIVLFYGGILFAYYIIFPLVLKFFTHVGPREIAVMTDISDYLSFALKLFIGFGIAFQIPIVTILLLRAAVITVESLKQKRPYVIVICFIFGMLLTPPDIFSQTLLAIPMWLLFELGLLGYAVLGKLKAIREKDD